MDIGEFNERRDLSLSRRMLLAFLSLLAGDAALSITLLPGLVQAPGLLIFYGIFSFAGWAMIGLPVALGVSPRFLCRLSGPLRLLTGLALGPLALLLIFVILEARAGTPGTFSLAHSDALLVHVHAGFRDVICRLHRVAAQTNAPLGFN